VIETVCPAIRPWGTDVVYVTVVPFDVAAVTVLEETDVIVRDAASVTVVVEAAVTTEGLIVVTVSGDAAT
jgi:hypothetical protein